MSFLLAPRRVDLNLWTYTFEPGTHGGALVNGGRLAAALLPETAIASMADAARFRELLSEKAGRPARAEDELWIFETDRVVATQEASEGRGSGAAAAAAWLAGMVRADGSVVFSADARTGAGRLTGDLHHARVATALRALGRQGDFGECVAIARRRLAADMRAALAGRDVAGWPKERDRIAGTLALASLAGARVDAALEEAASWPELESSPWHAAQVVLALGERAPPSLWASCVRALGKRPWAPWTALAAHGRGEAEVYARCLPPLVASVRAEAPYEGGVSEGASSGVPEIALTAIVVEALVGARSLAARVAVRRARAFLVRWQCLPACAPGLIDLRTAYGAFPASPVHPLLRVDVTAHACMALNSHRVGW